MSTVQVTRGKASVEVEADLWGDYTDGAIINLSKAVVAVCRAIDTEAAHELAERIEGTR